MAASATASANILNKKSCFSSKITLRASIPASISAVLRLTLAIQALYYGSYGRFAKLEPTCDSMLLVRNTLQACVCDKPMCAMHQ